MMGFSTPLRAGPAPRMELHEESVSEEKLPVVHTYGDADYSLRVVENYQDDKFASAKPKKSPHKSEQVHFLRAALNRLW